jgi:hypothetical protein
MAPIHDDYGKRVVRAAAGESNVQVNVTRVLSGVTKCLDAVIGSKIICEIEARNHTQVRAAYTEFARMHATEKLFLVMPANLGGERSAERLCENLRQQGEPQGQLIMVVLKGSGRDEQFDVDVARVREGLSQLGWTG